MRKVLPVLLLLLVFSFSAFCQGFEGKITYAVSYKSKNQAMDDAQFTAMMGNTMEYYIKGGSYKSEMNGSLLQWQLYPSQDSLLYSKMASTSSVYWTDVRSNNDVVLNAKINKGATTILGYLCDELILTCSSGVQKYYFSQKLPLDLSLFNRHQYGNWFSYLQHAKAVPLKMLVDNAQLVIESVATEVVPLKLETSLFQLTPGSKLEKMPF